MKAWMAALVLIGAQGQERAASRVPPAAARPPVRVRMETALGAIEIEVDAARAPVTAANFLRYVERGDYDGGRFHRTVRDGNQPGSRNPDGQGFAVFGRVVAGMDVVRLIHGAPADGQSLTPPVTIRKSRPVVPRPIE